jgi:hypothetical protein
MSATGYKLILLALVLHEMRLARWASQVERVEFDTDDVIEPAEMPRSVSAHQWMRTESEALEYKHADVNWTGDMAALSSNICVAPGDESRDTKAKMEERANEMSKSTGVQRHRIVIRPRRADVLDKVQGEVGKSVLAHMRAQARELRRSVRSEALRDYRRGDRLQDIALRYGTSTTAISLWAMRAGLPRRKRGCRPKDWPDREDIQIVQAVRNAIDGRPTLEEIGAKFGNKSRAGIHRIYTKWKDWKPRCPFKKGEVLRYQGRHWEVIKPGLFGGTVQNVETREKGYLAWNQKLGRVVQPVVRINEKLPSQVFQGL